MAKESIQYKNNKVTIKTSPKDGENQAVYVRPGDEIDLSSINNLNIQEADIQLIGGDITIKLPNGGVLTFVSIGIELI